ERAAAPAKKPAGAEGAVASTTADAPEIVEDAGTSPSRAVEDNSFTGKTEPDAEESSSDATELAPQDAGPVGENDKPQV
ncbi:MAG: hypothetical protein KJ052_13910, partial [Candidatus Hydrogenedentes bacterium]|nr:hypothetical protein [Candidatus Hydrogenedentota bacterium]